MGDFSVSAATVTVDHEGRVLLIQRADNGQWQIPGGVVEIGEQPTEAAVRETQEESGVKVELLGLSGVYTNIVRGIVAFVFLARPLAFSEPQEDETRAVEWVGADEAVERLDAVFLPRVADALSNRGEGVSFAAHDGVTVLRSSVLQVRDNDSGVIER